MTAAELEARIVEAEQNPALIRPLVRDFKAFKDGQLSDLTTQINSLTPTANAERDAIRAVHDRLRSACEESLAENDLGAVRAILQPAVDDARLTERERRIAELTRARDEAQRALDEASAAAVEVEPIRER